MARHFPLLAALVSGCLLVGCSARTSAFPHGSISQRSPPSPSPFAAQTAPADAAQAASPVAANTQQPADIVVIGHGRFSPNSLLAIHGQKIVLRLQATDATYGFTMPDLGIRVAVPQGQTVAVNLPTDQVGSFKFWDFLHPETGDWTTWTARGIFTILGQ